MPGTANRSGQGCAFSRKPGGVKDLRNGASRVSAARSPGANVGTGQPPVAARPLSGRYSIDGAATGVSSFGASANMGV